MYYTLKNIESKISKEIEKADDARKGLRHVWSEDPMADYISHEINGLKIAKDIVQREYSKELLELDKWATREMLKRDLK